MTTVSSYGPGIDAERAFKQAIKVRGGTVTDQIGMPLSTTDFAPFMQRVRDGPRDAVFGLLPADLCLYQILQ